MLKIYFGDMGNAIYNTSMYFDNSYLDCWLEDDMTKKIIKSVDKAEIIGTKAIESKALEVYTNQATVSWCENIASHTSPTN